MSVILMQSYIRTLSPEYEESARLDGAGEMSILWYIVLPLCKPMLATLGLFAAVGAWNRWWEGMLFMQRPNLWPLQLVLRNMLANANLALQGVPEEARGDSFPIGLQMAAVVVTMLPIICVYPFLQKHFVKGITLGGIKG
jgi:putative aldouronate transport system permease protein